MHSYVGKSQSGGIVSPGLNNLSSCIIEYNTGVAVFLSSTSSNYDPRVVNNCTFRYNVDIALYVQQYSTLNIFPHFLRVYHIDVYNSLFMGNYPSIFSEYSWGFTLINNTFINNTQAVLVNYAMGQVYLAFNTFVQSTVQLQFSGATAAITQNVFTSNNYSYVMYILCYSEDWSFTNNTISGNTVDNVLFVTGPNCAGNIQFNSICICETSY